MAPSTVVERVVISSAVRLIDLSCKIQAAPYRRRIKGSCGGSASLQLTAVPRFKCVALHFCFWLFVATHCILWVFHVMKNGLQVQSFIHIIYAAIFTLAFLFSLELTLNPAGVLSMQNRLDEMQSYFKRRWPLHPLAYLTLLSFQVFLVAFPILYGGLFFWKPNLPMFFLAQTIMKLAEASAGPYSVVVKLISRIVGGCVEMATMLWAVCNIFFLGQSVVIFILSLTSWLKELSLRIKDAPKKGTRRWMREVRYCCRLYTVLRLFNILGNSFMAKIIIPGEVSLVTLITSMSLCCTIRLYAVLPLFVYVIFPIIAGFLLTLGQPGIGGQIGKARLQSLCVRRDMTSAALHLERAMLLKKTVEGLEEMLLVRRSVGSLNPIGMELGVFGYYEMVTTAKIIREAMNITLLFLKL